MWEMMAAWAHGIQESAVPEWEGENNSFAVVEAGESCQNNPREGRMSGVMMTRAVGVAAGEAGSTVDGGWMLLLMTARGSVVIL